MQENHRITNLNIPKKSCPELYEELAGLTNRVRTERLRTLATIGLYSLHMQTALDRGNTDGSMATQDEHAKSVNDAAPSKTLALAQNKQFLKSKLFDSI